MGLLIRKKIILTMQEVSLSSSLENKKNTELEKELNTLKTKGT